jgi:UDP-glucuronate decarboxylase
MKTSLVTGGAGFLGSHICARLLHMGHKVISIDNLQTGRLINLEPMKSNPNFTFIEHDIREAIDIESDWIFNFACPASPPRYQADPIGTTETNVIGSLNMLELAKKHNSQIMQASTSEVYGDALEHPQTEPYHGNVNPIGPRSCYDEGKRCAESLFFDYHRIHDVNIKVIRIFNTYGPNMDPQDGRVISNFIIQALQKKPITIYGDGSQTRSFCFVDDLINGIISMMETDSTFIGPVNLGNPDEHSMNDIANKIKALTNSNSQIIHTPIPKDDPRQRKPDITLAKTKLSWQPKICIEEGLAMAIAYFKAQV